MQDEEEAVQSLTAAAVAAAWEIQAATGAFSGVSEEGLVGIVELSVRNWVKGMLGGRPLEGWNEMDELLEADLEQVTQRYWISEGDKAAATPCLVCRTLAVQLIKNKLHTREDFEMLPRGTGVEQMIEGVREHLDTISPG